MKESVYVHGNGAREDTLREYLGYSCNVVQNLQENNLIKELKSNDIKYVVVGGEEALENGLVDLCLANDIMCFGPTKEKARLETSKLYGKQIMTKLGIQTADYKYLSNAQNYVEDLDVTKCVIKKDMLARGKGVVLPKTKKEAYEAIDTFGSVLIEDKLYGEEVSIIAFCNGKKAYLMPQVKDYKQTHNSKNTGGMGSYAPANVLSDDEIKLVQEWMDSVVCSLEYIGFLYMGIMKTQSGIFVLEFNCRLGDPEAQSLLNLLNTSLFDIIVACLHKQEPKISWKSGYVSTVVLSHLDYPDSRLQKPTRLVGLDILDNTVKVYNPTNMTTGGRILSVTSYSDTLFGSISNVYNNMCKLELGDKKRYYRMDVALNELLERPLKRRIKIAILGSSKGSSLKGLIEYVKKSEFASIGVVVSDKRKGILELCDVPSIYHPYKDDVLLCNLLKLYDIDYIYLVGYKRILTKVIIDQFTNRIFNLHPSLLPRYNSLFDTKVHEHVLADKEYVTGCTLHLVTEKVDGGRIILQKQLTDLGDSVIELKKRVQELESECLVECTKLLCNGSINSKVTYGDTGVSIERGESVVGLLDKKIDNLKQFCSVQGDIALSTDGVGSKIKLASKHNLLYNAGIDLVAMCVNDILCHAAVPKYFLDYIATNKIDNKVDKLLEGVLVGCKEAGCKLVGGETAEMPSVYNVGDLDAGGFVMGNVIYTLDGDIIDGDTLVGLPSNGLHSNGFSLVNQLYKNERVDWDQLLKPTKIYVNQVREILDNYTVKAIVNITGGGWVKNIPRVLQDGQTFEVSGDWHIHEEFYDIQKRANLSDYEMFSTFNCGIGMILVTNDDIPGYPKVGRVVLGDKPRIGNFF